MNNDKIKNINVKIEKSIATFDDSKFLIDNNKLEIAINRLYYSIFYMISALAEKDNFETSKHTQLIGWFNKKYITSNIISKKSGKIVHKLFDLRTKADYDYYTTFKKEQVIDLYDETEIFKNELLNIIKTS